MTSRRRSVCLGVLLLGVSTIPTIATAQEEAPVPVVGRTLSIALIDGSEIGGELIEVAESRLVLRGVAGLQALDLNETTRIRLQRHRWTPRRVFIWSAIGAAVTGAGMTIACSQVDGTDCSGVFPGIALGWTLFGATFGLGLASGAWVPLPPDVDALRPYARFPQGAPAEFSVQVPSVSR